MKTIPSIVVALMIAGNFLIQSSFTDHNTQKSELIYPAEVKKVIDNKCYGCHSATGKSPIAKEALMWDNLPGLEKTRLVATLNKIVRVLKKNVMPPESVVKKYPEMKLLPDESKLLQSWAESKADSLLK